MEKQILITYFQICCRLILGGLLIFAGILKMMDNTALFETVAYLTWIPIVLKSLLVDLLPYIEIVTGALLISTYFDKLTIPLTAFIYLGFFIFAIYGLSTGVEGDCGCFGDLDESSFIGAILGSTFGWSMVIRNGVFVTMAGFLYWKPDHQIQES
jgi:uncharacterized membrane protein YphA (DoxX/SURF4 family)